MTEKFQKILQSPVAITITIIIVAGLFIGILYYLRKTKRKGSESKVTNLIKGIVDGLRSIANLKRPWLFLLHSVIIWVLYYLGVYIALFAFSFTSNLGASAALFLLVAGGIGMSAPVQGGIGAYHLLVSQGLLLYGVTHDHGLTFATLMHTSQTLVVIIFGGLAFLYLFFKRKNAAQNN